MRRRDFLCGVSLSALMGSALAQPAPIGGAAGYQFPVLGPSGGVGAGGGAGAGPVGIGNGPSLAMDFVNGGPNGDARLTTARAAGGATYFDQTGTMQLAAANTQRIDYGPVPSGVTNWVRNSVAGGAVVGTPGTAPITWSFNSTSIVGFGVEAGSGIAYIDVNFTGSGVTALANLFDGFFAPNAAQGQSWTVSMYLALVGGTLANVILQPTTRYYNSAQTFIFQTTTNNPVPVAGPMQRVAYTDVASATTQYAIGALRVATSGPYNCTLRIGGPQLEQAASVGAFIPTSGTVATVGAKAIGLLVEEGRTNSIRCSRCEGSVVGVPGTLPTNWGQTQGTGIDPSVIASGYENGIPFVDLQFAGTAAASSNSVWYEPPTGVAALTGQTWTISQSIRLIAGTLANISGIANTYYELTSASAFVTGGNVGNYLGVNGTPLSSQRVSGSYTTTGGATVAFLRPAVTLFMAAGAVSCTLRIGAPQMELGAFATSAILPAIGTPAATTRARDVVTMSAPTGFTGKPCAFSAQYTIEGQPAANARIVGSTIVGGGTVTPLFSTSTASIAGSYDTATTLQSVNTQNPGVKNKLASSLTAASVGTVSLNAGAVATATQNGSFASLSTGMVLLGDGVGENMSGWLSSLSIWNRALSNTELVQAST